MVPSESFIYVPVMQCQGTLGPIYLVMDGLRAKLLGYGVTLAGTAPCSEARTWEVQAVRRILRLCTWDVAINACTIPYSKGSGVDPELTRIRGPRISRDSEYLNRGEVGLVHKTASVTFS